MITGAATADKAKQKAREAKHLPPNTAAASAREIARRFTAVAAADKKIRTKLSAAGVKHKGVIEQEYPLNAIADANSVYTSTLVAKATTRHDGELISVRLRVDRVDRTTGAKTQLLDKFNTYPLAVYARAGSVVIETARLLPLKRSKNSTKPVIAARTTIYTAKHSDQALSAKSIAAVSIDPRVEEPCGNFPLVGGISYAGEPLVSQVVSPCDAKRYVSLSNIETQLQVWKDDGTRKDLGMIPVDSVLFGPQYLLSGSKLLLPNPYQPALAIKDVDTGTLGNLWSRETGFRDLAFDGTVALIGLPPNWEDGFFDGVPDTGTAEGGIAGGSTGTANPPPTKGFPVGALPTPAEQPKLPFVLFPGGDAENPVVLAPSSASISGIKFCGANLYALDSLSGASDRYEAGGYIDDVVLYEGYQYGEFEVQLYDLQGHLVRKLLKTKPMSFASLGCSGDRLIVVGRRGKGFSATEVGP